MAKATKPARGYDSPGPTAQHRPFLYVRHDEDDIGGRPVVGLSYLDYKLVLASTGKARLVSTITNRSAVSSQLCIVQFVKCTRDTTHKHAKVDEYGTPRQVVVPGGSSVDVFSDVHDFNWFNGCIVVRFFDPFADPYFGDLGDVVTKRHLAHFSRA